MVLQLFGCWFLWFEGSWILYGFIRRRVERVVRQFLSLWSAAPPQCDARVSLGLWHGMACAVNPKLMPHTPNSSTSPRALSLALALLVHIFIQSILWPSCSPYSLFRCCRAHIYYVRTWTLSVDSPTLLCLDGAPWPVSRKQRYSTYNKPKHIGGSV